MKMNKSLQVVIDKKVERTVAALRANNYEAHYITSQEELLAKVDEYAPPGAVCTVGGSMTLFETGVIDRIKGNGCTYLDRYAPGADTADIFRQAFFSDVYFTSSNAITEDGCLYNMDGNGNRAAAMIYGPKKVVVVAGFNKIVKTLEEARRRNREICAPANNIRLNNPNPCAKTGYCVDCKTDTLICVTEVVHRRQRNKERVAVLILPESYGY